MGKCTGLKTLVVLVTVFAASSANALNGFSLKALGGLSVRQNAPDAYSKTLVGAELGYLLPDSQLPLELSLSTLIVPEATYTYLSDTRTQTYKNSFYLLGATYIFSKYASAGLTAGYAAQRQKLSAGSNTYENIGSLAIGSRGSFDILLRPRWSLGVEAQFIWIPGAFSGVTAGGLAYLKFRF